MATYSRTFAHIGRAKAATYRARRQALGHPPRLTTWSVWQGATLLCTGQDRDTAREIQATLQEELGEVIRLGPDDQAR